MSELPDPIHEVLEDTADEARVRRLWAGIEARRDGAIGERRPTARRPIARVLVPMALAAAVMLAWVAWPEPPTMALTQADGAAIATVEAGARPRTIHLADGSRVRLDPGARLVPLRNDARALSFLLERGRARFSVTPDGPRAWTIESGVATVEVVGTVFTVARGAGEASVTVERGVVVVRGEHVPDRARRLTAGDALVVRDPAAGIPPVATGPAAGPSPQPRPEGRGSRPRPQRPASASDSDSDSASVSDSASASDSDSDSESASTPDSDSAPDTATLMRRADEARAAGRVAEAMALLDRASRGDGPDAALAAFTLGRLALASDPARAARAFERALALPLPPRLAEDAAARLASAHAAAGDREAARAAAADYLARYPEGRHAARARALLP